MRIAVFIVDFQIYYWQWFNAMINNLAMRGIKVDLFAVNQLKLPKFHTNVEIFKCSRRDIHLDNYLFKLVEKESKEKKYDSVIGMDLIGLILADKAAEVSGSKLVYYSCELYEDYNPGTYSNLIRLFLEHIRKIIPNIDLFLIQDEEREKIFFQILRTEKRPKQIMYFPIGLPNLYKIFNSKTNLRLMNNLASNVNVLLYVGALDDNRSIMEMVFAAQNLGPDQVFILICNKVFNIDYLKDFDKSNFNKKAILIIEDYEDEVLEDLVDQCNIGIVWYKNTNANDINTGRCSSKIALYLVNHKPVICPSLPSFNKDIQKYEYGESINNLEELPFVFNKILNDYHHYSNGAKRIQEEVFNQDIYIEKIINHLNTSMVKTISNSFMNIKRELHNSIAVIIPSYNRAMLLERAVDSVKKQTRIVDEIIIIDDASTDDTELIVKELIKKDNRIKYFRLNKNSGAQIARNYGIKKTTSDWISFLDSDDIWLPTRIESALGTAIKYHTKVVYSNYIQFESDEKQFVVNPPANFGNVFSELLKGSFVTFPGLFIKRKCFEKIGFLNENLRSWQEWETALRLSEKYYFSYDENPGFVWVIHQGETISKNKVNYVIAYLQIILKYKRQMLEFFGKSSLIYHTQNLENYLSKAEPSVEIDLLAEQVKNLKNYALNLRV